MLTNPVSTLTQGTRLAFRFLGVYPGGYHTLDWVITGSVIVGVARTFSPSPTTMILSSATPRLFANCRSSSSRRPAKPGAAKPAAAEDRLLAGARPASERVPRCDRVTRARVRQRGRHFAGQAMTLAQRQKHDRPLG